MQVVLRVVEGHEHRFITRPGLLPRSTMVVAVVVSSPILSAYNGVHLLTDVLNSDPALLATFADRRFGEFAIFRDS